jgi:hypothetical protein
MYTIRSTSNPCPENQPTDVLTENQEWLKTLIEESSIPKPFLQSIFCNLVKAHCCFCMTWNMKCKDLFKWRKRFVSPETIEISNILGDWEILIINSRSMW